MTTNRPVRQWIGAFLPAGLLCVAAAVTASGCSAGAAGASSSIGPLPSAYQTPSGTVCGTTRTAANTPVIIKVTTGTVACATALSVEDDYTALFRKALANGTIKGNGGGQPLTVSGWTCQANPTPQVLQTGVASECTMASADVVAVLDLSASPSTGS